MFDQDADGRYRSRREYLLATGVAAAAGLAGCLDVEGEASTSRTVSGSLTLMVTDQPGDIGDFESCVVTIPEIWLKPSGDGGDGTQSEDGRTHHEFDEPQEADLVDLQDGNTQFIGEREVDTGEYEFLQLGVSDVEATLKSGDSADVETPGQAPLKFEESFEVREDQRTTFVADFTPVKKGETGSYVLQPVASGTEVRYEDAEDE